jgi:hypothetical protein
VRKRGFCQPVAKHENEEQANILTRTSTKSSSVLNKKEKIKQKNNNKNLTFRSLPGKKRIDTE